jgi:hypothetical protein
LYPNAKLIARPIAAPIPIPAPPFDFFVLFIREI